MPICHGYIRLSKFDNDSTGYGLQGQTDEVLRTFQKVKFLFPEVTFGEIFQDADVSAHRTKKTRNIHLRPGGSRMMQAVKPGDHIIFAHSDRSFRDWGECGIFYRDCTERGIHIHFTDLPVVEDPWHNSTLLGVRAAFAQDQSDAMSRRTKAGLKVAFGHLPKHFPRKLLQKLVGPDGRHRWVPVRAGVVMIRYVQALRNRCMLSFRVISDIVERAVAKREKREPKRLHSGRFWNEYRCQALYEACIEVPRHGGYSGVVSLVNLPKAKIRENTERHLPAVKREKPSLDNWLTVKEKAAAKLAKKQAKLERLKARKQEGL